MIRNKGLYEMALLPLTPDKEDRSKTLAML